MVFGLFEKKDPVCGMKKEKEKGIEMHGKWFCSKNCLKTYEGNIKKSHKKDCCCN